MAKPKLAWRIVKPLGEKAGGSVALRLTSRTNHKKSYTFTGATDMNRQTILDILQMLLLVIFGWSAIMLLAVFQP